MNVVPITPHGFCGGVAGAIAKAMSASGSGKTYCLHELVHNELVIGELEKRGVEFVDDISEIPEGATALFSAHGVSPDVRIEAARRSLSVIDTTCPFVTRVHKAAKDFSERGLPVVVVGRKDHAEVKGILGEISGEKYIYPDVPAGAGRIGVVSQTTMNADEVASAVESLRARFEVETMAEVCNATKERQDAVKRFDGDAVLVLGSANSSNTRRLCEVAPCRAFRAATMDEVEKIDFSGVEKLGVTSGASTPESLFEKALAHLRGVVVALLAALAFFAALPGTATAETIVVDGVEYECRDGMCMPVGGGKEAAENVAASNEKDAPPPRFAFGYMDAAELGRFIDGAGQGSDGAGYFKGKSWWLVAILVLIGGFCMNLTPCVLPMIPVNILVIGRSAFRGTLYAAGIIAAYGTLGSLAVAGATSFGAIQSSGWFSLAMGCLFAALALAGFGVFKLDFSKWRPGGVASRGSFVFPLAMGALSAIVAGSCVAPVLVAVLLFAADLAAAGETLAAYSLVFLFAAGMASPWPFLGAGMKILPKPGAWMKRVNAVFALLIAALAAWYFVEAARAFMPDRPSGVGPVPGAIQATPANFEAVLASAKRPVFVDCTASWCKNCAAMERTTFRDEAIREKLRRFTVVRLDASDLSAAKAIPGFSGLKGLPAFTIWE